LFFFLSAISAALQVVAISLLREPAQDELLDICKLNGTGQQQCIEKAESPQEKPQVYSVSFSNAIKTGLFWVKWCILLSVSMLMGFMGSYQKTYGQIYIEDDIFLSTAATIQNVVNGTGRILWGFIFDYMGYRVGYIVGNILTSQ
jgi:hypothetical protein